MRNILVVSFILILSACFPDLEQKDVEYFQFLKQKSLDGKYDIYKYARNGMMAFSSDIYGIQIQKTGTDFKEGKGINIDGDIIKWISKDTLEVSVLELGHRPTDTLATVSYEKAYDLTLKFLKYKGNSGGTLRELYFESLGFKNDKLIFKNIQVLKGKAYKKEIELNLGDIEIEVNNDTISKFVHESLEFSMDGIYKHSADSIERNLPSIQSLRTYFVPTTTLKISDLNDIKGVFY
ncbi:hypothetical protein [Chondrinema litorale]|uniref:hypothetical protein n=1 Tax=Chondrinema litorale TaxID=2994555 RepID=UPI0025429456|nr:hypothetical protein [Chondrinema litorale]UZR96382.1 hypothetical protein OQ292_22255 [Chondrinema litorale]